MSEGYTKTERMPVWKVRLIAFIIVILGLGMGYFLVTGQLVPIEKRQGEGRDAPVLHEEAK